MKKLSSDARGFVEGVTNYIKGDARTAAWALPKVQSLFTKVTNAAKAQKMATVTSTVALTQEEKGRIVHSMSTLVGHDIVAQYRIDTSLLGGLKIQISDWVVDTSLSYQLSQMTKQLL